MFDELEEVKISDRLNDRFQESYNIKYFKEIKRLKNLEVKAEAYLGPKQASMMELFCKYT